MCIESRDDQPGSLDGRLLWATDKLS